jgi:CO/xanthine dehydrogenase Mo-binding subunit
MPLRPSCTQAAEVSGKGEGQARVVGFQAQDVGVAINDGVEGQIDGGAVQGSAPLLKVVIKDGEILNPSLTTYLMSMAGRAPIENILVQVPTDDGPFVRGCGGTTRLGHLRLPTPLRTR